MSQTMGGGFVGAMGGVGLWLSLATAACGSTDVSAGSEGDAINLGHCYGADCGVRVQAIMGAGVEVASCAEPSAELEEPLAFEQAGDDLQAGAIRVAPDGSVWVLERDRGNPNGELPSVALAHFSADGELLGTSGAIQTGNIHTWTEHDLAVDSSGVATVAVYTSFAATADSEVIEQLKLFSYDSELNPVGAPLVFHGVATPKLAGANSGTYWLAGNAIANAPHGVVSRVDGREPVWIQTGVPTSGQGAGVGVSGLVVASDGTTAVLSQRSPRWSGGPDVYRYGVATFDAQGRSVWNLELPTMYTGGYPAALAGTPEGDLVVEGVTNQQGLATISSVSRSGELGWAFEIESRAEADVDIDSEGRTFAATNHGVAVIDADGQSCRQLSVPLGDGIASGALPSLGSPRVRGNYIYLTNDSGLSRYTLPTDY